MHQPKVHVHPVQIASSTPHKCTTPKCVRERVCVYACMRDHKYQTRKTFAHALALLRACVCVLHALHIHMRLFTHVLLEIYLLLCETTTTITTTSRRDRTANRPTDRPTRSLVRSFATVSQHDIKATSAKYARAHHRRHRRLMCAAIYFAAPGQPAAAASDTDTRAQALFHMRIVRACSR